MTVRDGWPTCRMAPILSSFSNGVRSSGTAVISTTVTGLAAAAATSFISWSCAAEKVRFVASLPAETIACVQLSLLLSRACLGKRSFSIRKSASRKRQRFTHLPPPSGCQCPPPAPPALPSLPAPPLLECPRSRPPHSQTCLRNHLFFNFS